MKVTIRALFTAIALFAALAIVLSIAPAWASPSTNPTNTAYRMQPLQTMQTNTTTTTSNANATAPFGLGSITTPIVAWVKAALGPVIGNPPHIPFSTLFTMGVTVVMSLISSTSAKLLVDYDMVRSTMKEVQAWQKELNAAKKAKDDQTVSKLMKKSQGMMKQQSRASMEQMKVTAVTFVPFLLIWYLLNAVMGSHPVAFAPFPLPIMGSTLPFFWWYLLCSFSINLPLMRVFGIGMSEP